MSVAVFRQRRLTGRGVLALLAAFFAVIFAVNGTFAYFAIMSWPGVSRLDAYQAGLRYNDTLADARRQAALGWQSGVALDPDGALVVRIEDRDGNRIEGLDVTASLARPIGDGADTTIPLVPTETGSYRGRMRPPLAGAWQVTVAAHDVDGRRYRMTHDIFVQP